jgi:hypothetical protein
VPLALGLAAGTIAMWQTVPPKAGP